MVRSYPLKQSFIEYFQLDQNDSTLTHEKALAFIESQIRNASNPLEKALDIWDKFVMTNENFFDYCMQYNPKSRVKELRQRIQQENNVEYTMLAFMIIGISPFCCHTQT